ncbi:MAG: sulfatase-like hydrolase/transferase [Planctomycetaceae bacterium]|nr:sulfatase-like hydrolase/transferase [Planctomycetaceae bacterium]
MRVTLVFVLGLLAGATAAFGQSRPPNVVLIVADDLGYADLGVHGGKEVGTPNIDSLAATGMRFTSAYSSGCVCSPGRVGILTGRYQNRTGHDSNPRQRFGLDLAEVTLAQRLKSAGYKTGIVGKWHLGDAKEQHPLSRGFDEFYGILEHGIGPGERGGKEIVVHRGWEATETPADHTTAFGREAVQFIERHKDGPFFLYVPFTAVHAPHVAPAEHLQKLSHIADPRRRRYLAMLATLDAMVGQITAKLHELKLEENTIVAFMSDNGGPDGAPNNGQLRGGKWTLWEGGIRSPLLVAWKGRISPGCVSDEPVIHIDLAATALAAARIEPAAEWKLDGVSLLPLLEGKASRLDREALFWRFGPQFAVRQGHWKLVKPSLADEPMLFDLAADPGESKNLATEQPERVKSLTNLWQAWNAGNIAPRWDDERANGEEARKARKKAKKAGKN